MFAPLLAVFFACGTSPEPAPGDHAHGAEGHEHGAEGHEHGAEGHDHGPSGHQHAPEGVDHTVHHGGSDHMAQMAATREALRKELGAAYDEPVAGLDAADMTKGKATYDATCASCHGATGKGDGAAGAGSNPPPADFTDAFHARYYSDAGRVRIIQKGSPGTTMVGFEGTLDAQQILDVYAYVRSLR